MKNHKPVALPTNKIQLNTKQPLLELGEAIPNEGGEIENERKVKPPVKDF